MSKQKRGMFRRMVDSTRKVFGLPITHKYPDPILQDPRTRQKKRAHGHGSGRWCSKAPVRRTLPCDPGTLTYHDKLVVHFGARFANDFRRRYIKHKRTREPLVLPTEQEFIDNPRWAFLETQL
jgi:hypothetical protein